MAARVVIDCREHAVIEASKQRGREYVTQQLDVGDFHVLVMISSCA